jgi:hypothetical protein
MWTLCHNSYRYRYIKYQWLLYDLIIYYSPVHALLSKTIQNSHVIAWANIARLLTEHEVWIGGYWSSKFLCLYEPDCSENQSDCSISSRPACHIINMFFELVCWTHSVPFFLFIFVFYYTWLLFFFYLLSIKRVPKYICVCLVIRYYR